MREYADVQMIEMIFRPLQKAAFLFIKPLNGIKPYKRQKHLLT
jgi:hypothetical protein